MSTTMQLVDLRTAVRQRADMEGSQFISDQELNSYINQSYFELYDLLVSCFGDNYFVAPPVTFTADGASDQFALPEGTLYGSAPALLKLLGVDRKCDATSFQTLKPFNFTERNNQNVLYPNIWNPKYRLNGSQIWFTPRLHAGTQIQLWYVPRLQTLVNDSDLADGISGWTEYVIVDAAIKCMAKEESDPSVFMAQKQALIQRIQSAAENRDASGVQTVGDVYEQSGCDIPHWWY